MTNSPSNARFSWQKSHWTGSASVSGGTQGATGYPWRMPAVCLICVHVCLCVHTVMCVCVCVYVCVSVCVCECSVLSAMCRWTPMPSWCLTFSLTTLTSRQSCRCRAPLVWRAVFSVPAARRSAVPLSSSDTFTRCSLSLSLSLSLCLSLFVLYAGSEVVRIDLLRFLAGCRKGRLNQA